MRGYIALISILIISVIAVLIVISSVQLGIGQSKMAVGKNQSSESYYIAQACAEEALIKLAEDLAYQGNETINISGRNCQILPVEGSGGARTIKVLTTVNNKTKRVRIEINRTTPALGINFWQEVSSF